MLAACCPGRAGWLQAAVGVLGWTIASSEMSPDDVIACSAVLCDSATDLPSTMWDKSLTLALLSSNRRIVVSLIGLCFR